MATRKSKTIIIDTNLWISFLLTRDFSKLDSIISIPNIALLFSEELIEEFRTVAQRPKFRKYFSLTDIEMLLSELRNSSTLIPVASKVEISRDPKDDFLLALAKDGNATHLLTGDKDLLVIKRFGKTRIQTIAEFLSKNAPESI